MTKYPSKNPRLMSSKVVHRPLRAYLVLEGVALPAANSVVITPSLNDLFAIAGQNGTPIPLKLSTQSDDLGILSGKQSLLFKDKIKVLDNDVPIKGDLELMAGEWVLSFFKNNAAFTIVAGTYDVLIPYVFSFDDLPVGLIQENLDYLTSVKQGVTQTISQQTTTSTPSLVQNDVDTGLVQLTVNRPANKLVPLFRQVFHNGLYNGSLTTTLNTPVSDSDPFVVTIGNLDQYCDVDDILQLLCFWQ